MVKLKSFNRAHRPKRYRGSMWKPKDYARHTIKVQPECLGSWSETVKCLVCLDSEICQETRRKKETKKQRYSERLEV